MNASIGSPIRRASFAAAVALAACAVAFAADGSWLKHVPETDRERSNPYAGQSDAIAAGGLIFEERCAKCHGEDAEGRGKKPSLRSARVQGATAGEIFWLLRNGNLAKGMPNWSKLPEPERWQVIAFIKSLGVAGAHDTATTPHEVQP